MKTFYRRPSVVGPCILPQGKIATYHVTYRKANSHVAPPSSASFQWPHRLPTSRPCSFVPSTERILHLYIYSTFWRWLLAPLSGSHPICRLGKRTEWKWHSFYPFGFKNISRLVALAFSLCSFTLQAHVSVTLHRRTVKLLLFKITFCTFFVGWKKAIHGRTLLVVLDLYQNLQSGIEEFDRSESRRSKLTQVVFVKLVVPHALSSRILNLIWTLKTSNTSSCSCVLPNAVIARTKLSKQVISYLSDPLQVGFRFSL